MDSKHRYGIGLVVVAVGAVTSVLAAPELPQEVAVHWNLSGEADGYTTRPIALALLPGLSLLTLAGFALVPRIDPLGENFDEFRTVYDWLAVGTVTFLTYVHGIVLLLNIGTDLTIVQALAPAIGALYVVIGFVLERAERNWFVGVRTPWTLSDEQVWDRTHRHAAPLFKLAGVFALGAVAFPQFATGFLVGPIVLVALYTTAYSYVAYRRLDSR